MPPGASNLGENRFALLSSSPHTKRKKTNKSQESFPELPPIRITKNDDPKYVVLKTLDDKIPLSRFSCFAVHKAILGISKDVNTISELRDGSLLLLVKNKNAAEKFINTKMLSNICKISANYHEHLNSVKGTIFAPFLIHLPEKEIIEGLENYGVSAVYKFQKRVEGVLIPTGAMLVTFEAYKLPEKIDVAWRKISVRPYYPNPMRCKTCQKLGHTIKHCKGLPTCVNCSLPPHVDSECLRTMCANCSGEHPSSANICPKFIQAKEILKIKTTEKCSMREATNKYRTLNSTNTPFTPFSKIVSLHAHTSTNNNSTIASTIQKPSENNKLRNPPKISTNISTSLNDSLNSTLTSLPNSNKSIASSRASTPSTTITNTTSNNSISNSPCTPFNSTLTKPYSLQNPTPSNHYLFPPPRGNDCGGLVLSNSVQAESDGIADHHSNFEM